MFNFFNAIASIFTTIVDFIVGLFSMLMTLIKIIGSAFTFAFSFVSYMPRPLQAFLFAFIALTVLYQVLNKGA